MCVHEQIHKYEISLLSLYIIYIYRDIHIFAFLLVLKFLHNLPLLAVFDVT